MRLLPVKKKQGFAELFWYKKAMKKDITT